MLLLNFSHPLTAEHVAQIEALAGKSIEHTIDRPAQFDHQQPFPEQVTVLVDSVGLSSTEWQQMPILVNPPTLNIITVTLLAELHGRMGYFPSVLRLRPVPDSNPPQFEVAEIINLQAVRDRARERR